MSFGTECTLLLLNICVTNDHGYVQLVVIIFQTVRHAWFITGFVTRLKRWMPLVEQELLTRSEQLTSYPVWGGVCVTQSLVLCVCFVDCCILVSFLALCCLFFFDLRNLITPLVSSANTWWFMKAKINNTVNKLFS